VYDEHGYILFIVCFASLIIAIWSGLPTVKLLITIKNISQKGQLLLTHLFHVMLTIVMMLGGYFLLDLGREGTAYCGVVVLISLEIALWIDIKLRVKNAMNSKDT